MHEIEFLMASGETRLIVLNTRFVESTRQHAIEQGGPTAYVAPMSHVIGESIETKERCVIIALPKSASTDVDYSAASITPYVRRRADGTPVACAILANGRVAIHAGALNDAHPLTGGRITVLWMFEDKCTFVHCPYDEEAEHWFHAAAMVADGHRHETDYGAGYANDTKQENTIVEVLDYFMVEPAA
ncbi:hypothetical protein [Paraburkholderia tropica]|uniref:hypothetical protein n=1 Tax=Paraburkholderia tropica TaxID=92647 RepID=UPI001590513E|nr:hypothetical protein [Paraburkholderia tropica]